MISIRTTKILRDLWLNKSRTLLVVLSIAVGVAAFGLMITGRIVLQENLADEFTASNPAHSVLVLSPFDDKLIDTVKALPEVQSVEARHLMQAKIETTPNHWLALEIDGIPDFNQLTINRIKPQPGGTYPPPAGQILLERSAAQVFDVTIAQTVQVQTLDGSQHELVVAGFVNDLSRQPSDISLNLYAYASLPTLASLGEPTDYNRLYVVLKGASMDRVSIEQGITHVTTAIDATGSHVLSAPVPPPGEQVMSSSMNAVLLILNALGALTLTLSAFLVVNIMSAVISQQIPQIGILKSLGSPGTQLMGIYFELVLWFGLMGLALALPLGLIGAYFLTQGLSSAMNFDVMRFELPLQTVILQIVGAMLVPLAAATIPIWTGARITIREAISGNAGTNITRSDWLSRVLAGLGETSQLLQVSIGNTFRRKGRLLLTLTALSLAGAMFIALLGIRESMRQAVSDIQGSLNYDVSANFAQPYPLEKVQSVALQVPGITRIESWGLADGRRVYDDGRLSGSISLIAVPPGTAMAKPTITAGRWLQPDDQYTLFINADAHELAPDMTVGNDIKLRIGNDERIWHIVGISARDFTPIAYISYSDFENVTGLHQQTNMLVAQTENSSPNFQSKVQAALLQQFEQAKIVVTGSETTTELKESSAGSLDILIILLMVMVVLIAIVGGLGLAITMNLNVMERTREIGILRSLGATNGVIRRVVVVEGLLIGIVSWALGAVLSVLLGMWLGDALGVSLLARPLDYLFSVPALAIWLALVSVIAVVASLIPAQKAASLTIRDTLAYIG